jgi:hypothetical protein
MDVKSLLTDDEPDLSTAYNALLEKPGESDEQTSIKCTECFIVYHGKLF